MVPHQAEIDPLALLRPDYAYAEQEGRTLLHELFTAAGNFRGGEIELYISLAPFSSPHRPLPPQALCKMLNETAIIFPGSSLPGFTGWPPAVSAASAAPSMALQPDIFAPAYFRRSEFIRYSSGRCDQHHYKDVRPPSRYDPQPTTMLRDVRNCVP